ncbi:MULTISPECIES: hypothetical protein [Streptomyces]|uniref:Uncharacterized protein n=1 Tax=Streptomyces chilikensis TaxID=1194079 RepID=A0ABV3EZ89_9ACTN|nr:MULTISPECIES: hypothetical protein [Streptomyces]MDH6224995.1 hypothetical protein [Streptomyces sp. MJP52]
MAPYLIPVAPALLLIAVSTAYQVRRDRRVVEGFLPSEEREPQD